MRILLQRVLEASVTVDDAQITTIKGGLLLFVGFTDEDTDEDLQWLSNKILQLRIFEDENNKMNLSVQELDLEILVVSQFTLFASTKKGNRPSFMDAANPEKAEILYINFLSKLRENARVKVQSGQFGADMKVHLINDGPVTLWLDSKRKE